MPLTTCVLTTPGQQFLIALIALPFGCRYLERLWGMRELLRFSAIVIVGSNVIAFGFAWLTHLVLGAPLYVFHEEGLQ